MSVQNSQRTLFAVLVCYCLYEVFTKIFNGLSTGIENDVPCMHTVYTGAWVKSIGQKSYETVIRFFVV